MSDPRLSLGEAISLEKSKVRPYEGFILLCGGPVDGTALTPPSVRDIVFSSLEEIEAFDGRVKLAENYKSWSHDSVYSDLLTFESHIAQLSSIIVLIVESAGSIAELGLFSAMSDFQKKLLVILDNHHYESESFIRLGPIDHLEKVHGNTAHCHRWMIQDGNRLSFQADSAKGLKDDFVESINERLRENVAVEQVFDTKSWLHAALLICDLVNLMSALTVREIRDYLLGLGVPRSESEIRQFVYILQQFGMLQMEGKAGQRFYLSRKEELYLRIGLKNSAWDVNRFRADTLNYYDSSEKKRFKAILAARGKP